MEQFSPDFKNMPTPEDIKALAKKVEETTLNNDAANKSKAKKSKVQAKEVHPMPRTRVFPPLTLQKDPPCPKHPYVPCITHSQGQVLDYQVKPLRPCCVNFCFSSEIRKPYTSFAVVHEVLSALFKAYFLSKWVSTSAM
jgi:hypothetical protein